MGVREKEGDEQLAFPRLPAILLSSEKCDEMANVKKKI